MAVPHFESGHYLIVQVYWTSNIFLQKKSWLTDFFHSYRVVKLLLYTNSCDEVLEVGFAWAEGMHIFKFLMDVAKSPFKSLF